MPSISTLIASIFGAASLVSGAAIDVKQRSSDYSIQIHQYSGATCQQHSNQWPFSRFSAGVSTQSVSGDLGDWPRSVEVILPPQADGVFHVTMTDSHGKTKTFKNEPSTTDNEYNETVSCDDSGCSVCTTANATGPNGPSWVSWKASQSS